MCVGSQVLHLRFRSPFPSDPAAQDLGDGRVYKRQKIELGWDFHGRATHESPMFLEVNHYFSSV